MRTSIHRAARPGFIPDNFAVHQSRSDMASGRLQSLSADALTPADIAGCFCIDIVRVVATTLVFVPCQAGGKGLPVGAGLLWPRRCALRLSWWV